MTEEKKQFNNKVDAPFKDRVDGHLEMIKEKYEDIYLSANSLVQKSVTFCLDFYDENGRYPFSKKDEQL